MESIAAVFGAIARGLRGLFDLASMAVGVAPTSMGLSDAACCPLETHGPTADLTYVDCFAGESPFAITVTKVFDVSDCTSIQL